MVAVLLVLMALFVLCAPFLLTVGNADRASAELADRSSARLALDSALRHARGKLSASHPALDPTPSFDSEDELAVRPEFDAEFLEPLDPTGVMWDLDVEDDAGRVDLNSASPHVLANLIDGAARLTALMTDKSTTVELNGTGGFLPQGFAWIESELVGYGESTPASLGNLTRGVMQSMDESGSALSCGPQGPMGHALGATVIDQRAWAIAEWRIAGETLRSFAAVEEARDAQEFALAEEIGDRALEALLRTTSVHAGVRAGAVWQHAARVVGKIGGEPEYGCSVPVDDARWFSPGTTVRIRAGEQSELGLVRASAPGPGGTGGIVLTEPLAHEYEPFETTVEALARRPVNVNTASREVLRALFLNLKLREKSARITPSEADELVELVRESRPFTGFEDFLVRLVLPAAGLEELPQDAPVVPEALAALSRSAALGSDGKKELAGLIDADDGIALYKNALNANDGELEFATMPFAFTSRDVYDLELRASVNAQSGIERASGVRELSVLVVPQRDLLGVWTRQEDFDLACEQDRDAACWTSGPKPTGRFDPMYGDVSSTRWPTRARAHLGLHDTFGPTDPPEILATSSIVPVFPSREEDGWLQLAPARTDEAGNRRGHVLHFDDETQELEGRYLPDGPVLLDPAGGLVGWSGAGSALRPVSFSMWVKPREIEEGALFLDVGGPFTDSDRLSLLFEEGDLVLRLLDGAGDHPSTSFVERAEVRHPLDEGPGLPADVWSHVAISVEGTRPDQMTMLVDGRSSARTPGLTRLTSSISGEEDEIPVESTEGFPERCVLRIGEELIEATKEGEEGFRATYNAVGELAGFGGRLAREYFQGAEPNEVPLGLHKANGHAAGTVVQLYGYSLVLFSNVPNASTSLPAGLGPFAVLRVVGIVDRNGQVKTQNQMEPIDVTSPLGETIPIGHGMNSRGNDVQGLVLTAADPDYEPEQALAAFPETGGYAALLAWKDSFSVDGQLIVADSNGAPLGGVEVIRYERRVGDQLLGIVRGDVVVSELANLRGVDVSAADDAPDVVTPKAFTFWYTHPVLTYKNELLTRQAMIVPISLPLNGFSGGTSFLEASLGDSQFAQITHVGEEAHLTEWVRYDEITTDGRHLVRDDPQVLDLANEAAHGGVVEDDEPDDLPRPGDGGGTVGQPIVVAPPPASVPSVRAAQDESSSPPSSEAGSSTWYYGIGERENDDLFVTRSVASHLQFRGVMGTYSHEHPEGAAVVPVFQTRDLDVTAGLPGRFDAVMFLSGDATEPSFPGLVQHAHRPSQYTRFFWQDGGSPLSSQDGAAPVAEGQSGMRMGVTYVALQEALAVPFAASPIGDAQSPLDTRQYARMALFPSGELPREVTGVALGGDYRSPGTAVPSAVVDEAVFLSSSFGGLAGISAQMVLDQELGEDDDTIEVRPKVLRTTSGDLPSSGEILAEPDLPETGGLLKIGDEVLCYDSYEAVGHTLRIPEGGRGLLGTDPGPHEVGEGVGVFHGARVAILAQSVGEGTAELALLQVPQSFPRSGLVLIEDELVHYTHIVDGALAMPRASEVPGRGDGKGRGLFRGRFGTSPSSHPAGTPVIVFPFRYADQWSERADAPELAYFGLACDQPDAFWKKVFWSSAEPEFAGPELGVLQRTDAAVPWDEDPEKSDGTLQLLWQGRLDGEGNAIGVQADRVEWRIFVRHRPESFDAQSGLSHGWKTTPRLDLFGVEYLGPGRTLRRVDR